jgi:LPPG:FO 2-phospho-L-lactate transferase
MRLTIVLDGDGAPFAHALAALLEPADELTVVVPTVRDRWVTGLKASPDLDALLGAAEPAAATHGVADELHALGYSPAWQRPTDAEVAGRLVRTELLGAGYTLTDATAATVRRRGLPFRVLPMSDDRAELHVVVTEADGPRAVHVEEYLADPAAHEVDDVVLVAGTWGIGPEADAALTGSDVLVLGPASRTLAIDPVLRTPGLGSLADAAVLVVDHDDTAPPDLVRAAGLREADPRRAEQVPADPAAVVARARTLAVAR